MVTGANAFVDHHSGFRLNEMVVQGETPEHLAGILNFGALLFGNTEGCYVDSPKQNPDRVFEQPHLAGLTREAATRRKGSWLGSLFLYQPPRLGFSRGEQQLLFAAMGGKTDEELSDSLGVSQSAVKKTWRAIYARVGDNLPELIPNQLSEEELPQDRGKEKKRRLLAYLREHPEELRPYSRKLLQTRSADPCILPHRKSSPRQSSLLRSSRNALK
jgi:DNA-binding CsgD family transcriptional regulator